MTGGSWITHHFVYNFVESLEFLASNLRNEIRGEVGRRIPNTQNCQQITNESPRAPRNLTPPGSSDKPTWRCQQIPLIGALGIQVICYPRRAFQERLINDRKDDQPLEAGEGGDSTDYLAKGDRRGNLRSARALSRFL